ncbi:MAG: hypothetical protein JWO36_5809 [Myxococcales bacterium]|nr:hypothetical protein [Myxococcales bacterium]
MRVLAWTNTGLHEIVADGAGGWTDIPHAFSELGVTSANTFGSELSPDGLRLVLVAAPAGGGTRMLYADRPSPGAPFSKVQPIEDLQYLANGFMTEDCGRVYFTTLSSVFYVPRD